MISIDLAGKTALITGGGQGLGAATAGILYQAGANVVVNYLEDATGENRRRALETIAPWQNRGRAVAGDVGDPQSVAAMLDQAAQQFGPLDIVVNNAGILRDKTVKKMPFADWEAVIHTNLTGVFNVCQAALSKMNDGGRIVNMASISGEIGFYGQANYAAAKAGVVGLTKVLSRELAKRRITVNAVAPGVVRAGMGLTIPDEVSRGMLASVPLGRFAEPGEIASVILFLCSDLASYVTGQTLHVNGGWCG